MITRLADLGGAHGYSEPGRITILESLTRADTAAVLVHEFAHELLHQRGDDRQTSKTVREIEAEAVAFIVTTAIGVRSSVDAIDYIQLYDGNPDTLRQSLHRSKRSTNTILKRHMRSCKLARRRRLASNQRDAAAHEALVRQRHILEHEDNEMLRSYLVQP